MTETDRQMALSERENSWTEKATGTATAIAQDTIRVARIWRSKMAETIHIRPRDSVCVSRW